jgi:hypothetical protein
MTLRLLGLAFASVLIAGCTTPRAAFVTKTSLSIVDLDTTPAGVAFGFDRVEGFIAPLNPDGTVPPVVAKIETDGKIFDSKVKQIYATGKAAEAVAGLTPSTASDTPDGAKGAEGVAFFGTSTSTALKIGFAPTGVPNTFVLGYRRKELSVIPKLASVKTGTDTVAHYVYPQLLAAIDTQGSASQPNSATFGVCQSFASGAAATKMAADARQGLPSLRCGDAKVEELFSEYRSTMAHQTEITASLLRCYAGVAAADRVAIWEDAARHGLFVSADEPDQVKAAATNAEMLKVLKDGEAQAATRSDASAQNNARRVVDRMYADFVFLNNSGQMTSGKLVSNPTRERLLTIHKDEVCRRNQLNQP